MGIESDQLVFDYLSRVGDVAQQRQLPSGERMRLVSTLRKEIDRQRRRPGSGGPAAVRRILGRLGTPDAVVRAASEGGFESASESAYEAVFEDVPQEPRPTVPGQRTAEPVDADVLRVAAPPPPLDTPAPEFGEPDWWRIQLGPLDPTAGDRGVWAGIEIPEILKPPPEDPEETEKKKEKEKAAEEAEKGGARGWWLKLRRLGGFGGKPGGSGKSAKSGEPDGTKPDQQPGNGGKPAKKPGVLSGFSSPFLLVAAVLLVAGAVTGSWVALGLGWLLAYASRRLSRTEAKWAVFGLPGVSAAGGLVWLWGRMDGRWGERIPDTGMAEALSGAWPVVLRTAAVTSALYLIWRARRR
ncbi:P-loop NTPase family protein [Streptomyces odonnellii]|uniref:hypothetical protein n=1 Tax=Streptomyces odonnellii TaxID=1417980 RepID=UPI000626B220|nr:hypothetical protein [Streptomyces odonnellii]